MELLRPGMGTENSLNVIAALVQMKRPRSVLEIGAGDSTVAIARALAGARKEHIEDRKLIDSKSWSERGELLIPREAHKEYNPLFISIDNFSAEGCSAEAAWKSLDPFKTEGLNVNTLNCDFFAVPNSYFADLGGLDFVWIDAGTLTDDVRFIGKLWPLIAPGGILALHEPYFTASIEQGQSSQLAMVRTPLWEAIVKNIGEGVDILSVPETHKYRQTGLGILRKHESWERPRSSTFQEEMMSVAEPPARFSVTGIRNDKSENLRSAVRKIGHLKKENVRKVLYAIGLGITSLGEIGERLKLDQRALGAICKKLLNSGFIEYRDGQFFEVAETWSEFPDDSVRDDVEMTDISLEDPEILDLIVGHLERDRTYSEAEISGYCRVFTEDFARLRRKLVDTRRLERNLNQYRIVT
jgi:hypothetical protein